VNKDNRQKPLSARRARHEAEMARINRRPLPSHHPYGLLPTWVPFGFAQRFGKIVKLLTGGSKASSPKRPDPTSTR